MTWAHPILLALAPIAFVASWCVARGRRRDDVARSAHIQRRWTDRHGLSPRPPAGRFAWLRGALLGAGVALALLALARPRWGEMPEETVTRSRDVILALDLSRSMLATDVAPSRLERAKLLVTSLLDALHGERVGLIVFSGTAFVQSPLSSDYEVLRELLAALDPSYLPAGGTDYEAMLRAALQGFGPAGGGDRFLVVLSDGEALDEHWQTVIPALRERGIRVIGLGVGTPEGALITDRDGTLVKDEHGAAVLSRLEPGTLRQLAEATGGAYRDAAAWVDVAPLVEETVAHGRRGEQVEQRGVRLRDRFQWFLAPAVVCLLLSYWLDLPLAALARALPRRGRRPHPAPRPALAAAFLALVAWHVASRPAHAAAPDTPSLPSGAAAQRDPLTATIEALSAKTTLTAADYARLASETIDAASQPHAASGPARTGILDDALAAVARGEAAGPTAADWPHLRAALEALRQEQAEKPDADREAASENPQSATGDQPSSSGNDATKQGHGEGADADHEASESTHGAGDNRPSAGANDAAKQQPGAPRDAAREDSGSAEDAGGNPPSASGTDPAAGSTGGPSASADTDPSDAKNAGNDDSLPRERNANGDAGDGEHHTHEQAGEPRALPEASGLAGAPAAPSDSSVPPDVEPVRVVGGGRPLGSASDGAGGVLDQLKDADAPALLFERMNRADGAPHPRPQGKNW